jgi:hypothetical protein
MTNLPKYVEFGLRSSSPGPYRCDDAHMRGFVLKGNGAKIKALIKKTLSDPPPDGVEYRPVSDRVMALVGNNKVSSLDSTYKDWGWVPETLVALFVPVWGGHMEGSRFVRDRFCMALPQILVDNPMSLVTGREVYGFPKALGLFDPADAFSSETITVKGFGGNFDPDAKAGWFPLLTFTAAGHKTLEAERVQWRTGLPRLATEVLGITAQDFRSGAKTNVVNQVFLKQFRDVTDPFGACYQAVVEVPMTVTAFRWRWHNFLREWTVRVHPLQSHPISEELGIQTQTTRLTYETEFSFECGMGSVIGAPTQRGAADPKPRRPRAPASRARARA